MNNPTIVFLKPGEVLLEDRPKPEPSEGELLIQTNRTMISTGTELTILSGEFPPDSRWSNYGRFPFVAGYLNAGKVIGVGKGVDSSWEGKRVVSGTPHAAFVTAGADEAPQKVFPIPDRVSDEQAVFFGIAAHFVMNGIRRSKLTWGEVAVVYGLGLLGQLAARICAIAGAKLVICIDVSESRLAMLPKGPQFVGLHGQKDKLADRVRELTQGRMADVVFELTGSPQLIPQEFKLLREQGRFVVLSAPRGPTPLFDFHDLCCSPSFTIIGAHGKSTPAYETPDNPWTKARHIELFFDWVASGALDVTPLITNRVLFSEAPSLYKKIMNDRSQVMGEILQWT
jgi:2-desacetyl-2-hydroxyethyl bacteriochlorophyllide A dehydrogenase